MAHTVTRLDLIAPQYFYDGFRHELPNKIPLRINTPPASMPWRASSTIFVSSPASGSLSDMPITSRRIEPCGTNCATNHFDGEALVMVPRKVA